METPLPRWWKYIWPCWVVRISYPSGKSSGWCKTVRAKNLTHQIIHTFNINPIYLFYPPIFVLIYLKTQMVIILNNTKPVPSLGGISSTGRNETPARGSRGSTWAWRNTWTLLCCLTENKVFLSGFGGISKRREKASKHLDIYCILQWVMTTFGVDCSI